MSEPSPNYDIFPEDIRHEIRNLAEQSHPDVLEHARTRLVQYGNQFMEQSKETPEFEPPKMVRLAKMSGAMFVFLGIANKDLISVGIGLGTYTVAKACSELSNSKKAAEFQKKSLVQSGTALVFAAKLQTRIEEA